MPRAKYRPLGDSTDEELEALIDKRVREVGGLKQNAGKDEHALLREALRAIIRSIEQPPIGDDDFAAEDRAWREEQEKRYREEYGWESSNANDDAALSQLIDMESAIRRINVDLRRASLGIKQRAELWDQLRAISSSHASLQKQLGIDRSTRDQRSRNEDPLEVLRQQIHLGALHVKDLRAKASKAATEVQTTEELVARAQNHSGLAQSIWGHWLVAYDRINGRDPDPELLAIIEADEASVAA